MNKIFLLSVFCLFSFCAFSQNKATLSGSVALQSREDIGSYEIHLLSADSAVIVMDVFFENNFTLTGIDTGLYFMRIHSIQTMPYDTLIHLNSGQNIILAPIILRTNELSEAVVTGKKSPISYNNGNISFNVANTYLKDESGIINILGKIPSIMVDYKGSISVFGNNNLAIYINERRVKDQAQVKSLQSADIDKIELIRNVGVEYSASTDVVLKIWTKKRYGEKLFLAINNNTRFNNNISNDVNFSFFYNTDKRFSHFFTFHNDISKSERHDKSYTYTFLELYENLNFRDVNSTGTYKSNNLFYALNYSFNNNYRGGTAI
jgi:hypothetical protein